MIAEKAPRAPPSSDSKLNGFFFFSKKNMGIRRCLTKWSQRLLSIRLCVSLLRFYSINCSAAIDTCFIENIDPMNQFSK
jgi:hypothetical protein